jgi:hypothetical protein
MDPRFFQMKSSIVEKKTNFKVIRAVDPQISLIEQADNICRNDIDNVRFDHDVGIKPVKMASSRFGLSPPTYCILFVVQHLPLEIRPLDDISIEQQQPTNSCSGKQFGGNRTQGTTTHDSHRCGIDARLAIGSEDGQSLLAIVSRVRHRDRL